MAPWTPWGSIFRPKGDGHIGPEQILKKQIPWGRILTEFAPPGLHFGVIVVGLCHCLLEIRFTMCVIFVVKKGQGFAPSSQGMAVKS